MARTNSLIALICSPVCPHCGGLNAYECRRPNGLLRFRLFHKVPLRGYLAAIAIFCNEVKGKQEASWREDHRRVSNGDQVHMVSGLAMKRGPSVDFSGYWQRHTAA
jgi:hypothetical protein